MVDGFGEDEESCLQADGGNPGGEVDFRHVVANDRLLLHLRRVFIVVESSLYCSD